MLSPKQEVGSYVIERELGRGGMGAIYLGVHRSLGKRCAIKILLPELSRREDLIARFWAEARAVTAIKHPSIVDVYDYGATPEGHTYIVMEYLEGETLGARLKARGLLPIPQAVTIARQVATALAAAHAVGVVHRDLKPDNIFLVDDPEVAGGQRAKLLDFGVAKLVVADDETTAKTVTGTLLGTPQYMSPEQCEGARAVDHRSDLYSLGCTIFQMVSGRLPFESAGIGGLIGMHLHVPPPKLREHAPHASTGLEDIVARLLEKQPDARFASAADLAAALSVAEASEVDAAASAPLPRQVVHADVPTAVSRVEVSGVEDTAVAAPPQRPSQQPAPRPVEPRPRRSRWAWLATSVGMVGAIAFVIAMSLENPRSDERFGDISVFVVDAAIDVAEPSAVDAKRPVAAEVLALLHERKWIAAGLRARDLEETGMSRAQIAELLAHEAPQAARLVEARIQELVDGDDCVTAINEAMQFERGWDTVARRAILIARGCEIESAADSDVYETVLAASEAGHVKLALETCQKQKRMPREVRIVCALAACVAKAPRLQKQWQAQLDAPDLARVTEYCGARRAAD